MELEVKGRSGDRLVAAGALKQEQLEVALNEQRRAHRPLGQILTSLGFVRPEHLAQLVAALHIARLKAILGAVGLINEKDYVAAR